MFFDNIIYNIKIFLRSRFFKVALSTRVNYTTEHNKVMTAPWLFLMKIGSMMTSLKL